MSCQDAKSFIEIPALITVSHPVACYLVLHMSSHSPIENYIKYRNIGQPTPSLIPFVLKEFKLYFISEPSEYRKRNWWLVSEVRVIGVKRYLKLCSSWEKSKNTQFTFDSCDLLCFLKILNFTLTIFWAKRLFKLAVFVFLWIIWGHWVTSGSHIII